MESRNVNATITNINSTHQFAAIDKNRSTSTISLFSGSVACEFITGSAPSGTSRILLMGYRPNLLPEIRDIFSIQHFNGDNTPNGGVVTETFKFGLIDTPFDQSTVTWATKPSLGVIFLTFVRPDPGTTTSLGRWESIGFKNESSLSTTVVNGIFLAVEFNPVTVSGLTHRNLRSAIGAGNNVLVYDGKLARYLGE